MHARRAAVVARTHSRQGQAALDAVPALLKERGLEVVSVAGAGSRKKLVSAVERAVKQKPSVVVVCGGDGTLTSAVGAFAKRDVTLGIVPSGTVNSFSRNFGIGQSFEEAADVIAFGHEQRVDLGWVNGRYFANFLTVGFEADAANRASRGLKRVLGPLAYGAAALIPFLRHQPFDCDLRWNGHRLSLQTHEVIVSSGRFFGYKPLDRNATQTDGELTIFVRDRKSRIDLLQTYVALTAGEDRSLAGVHLWNTSSKVKIRARPRQMVQIDGHVLGKTPIRIKVVPGALRVMVAERSEKSLH